MSTEAESPSEQKPKSWKLGISLLVVMILTVAGLMLMAKFKPEAKKEERTSRIPSVKIFTTAPGALDLVVTAQAVVESRRVVQLSSEIAGKIIEVSPQWKRGGTVKKNDVLVRMDRADYTAARARMESSLAQSEETLALETAQSEMAIREWQRVSKEQPSPLTRREPQLRRAQAAVASAQADLQKAQRDEERTEIRAPFDGRVRMTHIEEGAFVAAGLALGEMYADQDLELRVPISLEDYGLVADQGKAQIKAKLGSTTKEWTGELVRFDGEIERSTNSGYAIVKVLPSPTGMPPVGLFVHVTLPTKPLENVVKIPRIALMDGQQVIVVNDDATLTFKKIELIRAETHDLFVRGIGHGEKICITRMQAALPGMKVEVIE